MTKQELIDALQPFVDEIEIVVTNGTNRLQTLSHSYGWDENKGIFLIVVPAETQPCDSNV